MESLVKITVSMPLDSEEKELALMDKQIVEGCLTDKGVERHGSAFQGESTSVYASIPDDKIAEIRREIEISLPGKVVLVTVE
jgi:hypothetical protein